MTVRHSTVGGALSILAISAGACSGETTVVEPLPTQTTSSTSSSGGGGQGGEAGGCVSNAQCTTDLGAPHLCRTPGDVCVPLASPECAEIIGAADAFQQEDVLVVGMITPPILAGEGDPSRVVRNAAELAVEEIDAAGGIPRGTGRSDVVVVRCEEGDDAMAAARHLIDDVGVDALLGPFEDRAAAEAIIGDLLVPTGTPMFSPLPSLAVPPGAAQDLVWRLRPDGTFEARAFGHYLAEYLAAQKSFREEDPAVASDVLFLAPSDGGFSTFRSTFEATASWNAGVPGVPVGSTADNQAAGHYDSATYASDLTSVAIDVVSSTPDVIVLVGDDPAPVELMQLIEDQWPAGQPRPWWLANARLRLPIEPLLDLVDGEYPVALGDRIYGFLQIAGTDHGFPERYLARFPVSPLGSLALPTGAAALAYDAVYAIASSAAASPGDIATGMTRLLGPGPTYRAHPSDLAGAFAALASGENVDFDGAGSNHDDPFGTGSFGNPLLLWCGDASTLVLTSSYEWDPDSEAFDGLLTVCDYITAP